ncbi:MAG: nicotinate (nicotinamide) nucleotide adenylyltransferase [Ignavibacteria bacterium]|nr:nicotinate (nicotinamide) nucleotide adenylyltransferase [Ignavibacteria bacterium]
MKNKIGIFGGTFDPIHYGHLITAQYVLEKRDLEKIFFIPCYVSPHKTNLVSSESEHRLNMVKLAISNIPFFDYSDYEIKSEGISYTYNTLLHLSEKYESLELIIGYDNLLVFDKWNQPDEIIRLAKLVVMKRKTDIEEKRNRFFNNAVLVDTPTIEISSTDIRERVRNNLPIDFLVPESVKKYIYEVNLYKQ